MYSGFKAASSNPVNGLNVFDVTGDYASVIACGYTNTIFENNIIRGGAAYSAISILNGSVDLPTARYGNETSETNKTPSNGRKGKIIALLIAHCQSAGLTVCSFAGLNMSQFLGVVLLITQNLV